MDAYLTASDARTLGAPLAVIDGMTALLALADDALTALLQLASSDIDQAMRYQGRKFDESGNQTLAFPRIPYGTLLRNQLAQPVIGGIYAGLTPYAGMVVWDWDDTLGQAVVPEAVQLACICQAAWMTTSAARGAARRADAIRQGLSGQSIGTAQETYFASGGFMGLSDRATRIMEKYRLRSGAML